MSRTILTTDRESLLGDVFDGVAGDAYVVDPDSETIEALVAALDGTTGAAVTVLAGDRVLKDTLDDFLVGATAADLVATDRLALRAADLDTGTLVVTDEQVVAVVAAGGQVAGLTTDDADFVAAVRDQYAAVAADASPYSLRTPPLSTVRETLSAGLGDDARADFDGVLASLETARGDGDGLDEVTISLLVAARNEELLYDISKWGEDVGIASKATFSRTKTRLEELGLIDTEKVPIDVGRPRLRLVLGDPRLKGVAPDELANVAQSILAS